MKDFKKIGYVVGWLLTIFVCIPATIGLFLAPLFNTSPISSALAFISFSGYIVFVGSFGVMIVTMILLEFWEERNK